MKPLPPSNSIRLLWGDDMAHRDEFYKAEEQAKIHKHLREARARLANDISYTGPYKGSKYANGKYAHQVREDHPWRTPRPKAE